LAFSKTTVYAKRYSIFRRQLVTNVQDIITDLGQIGKLVPNLETWAWCLICDLRLIFGNLELGAKFGEPVPYL